MNENEIDDGLTPEERAAIASDDDLIETDDEGGDDADASDQENGAQGDDEAGDDAGDGVDAAAAADPAIHDDAFRCCHLLLKSHNHILPLWMQL